MDAPGLDGSGDRIPEPHEFAGILEGYTPLTMDGNLPDQSNERFQNAAVEATAQAQRLLRERDEARAEVARLQRRIDHTEQWYGSRWKRIADELRDSDVWGRVACIMANGTAEAFEPPTYDQQMNILRHENKRLREALDA